MRKARITNIEASEDLRRVEGSIDLGVFGTHRIYFASDKLPLRDDASAFVCAALLPCMELGLDCEIDGPADQRLLDSTDAIQDIFCGWNNKYRRVQTSSTIAASGFGAAHAGATGTFFSGGIDSTFTLKKHIDDISHLIFVHGFDLKLEDRALRDLVANRMVEFASNTGKQLIQIETNVGVFLRRFVGWSFGHGPALAAVGHTLAAEFSRIYIPATHALADDVPWGSHPLVDPLWSGNDVEFIHDGDDTTRVNKTDAVAGWEPALKCLRVCWRNDGGSYNCGVCAKCLRTMVTLAMLGRTDALAAFDEPLDLKRVSDLQLHDDNARAFAREILDDGRLQKNDTEMYTAVQNWLRPPSVARRINQIFRKIRLRRVFRHIRSRTF